MNLSFDPGTHTYRMNGVVIPSVTQIIAPVLNLSGTDSETLERARLFGIAAHKATELWDQGTLDMETLDPALIPYLEAWKRFRHEHEFEPEMIEYRVCHWQHRYAGTVDRIGMLKRRRNRVRAVLDIKSGLVVGPHVGVQLAGYQHAYNFNHQGEARHRVSVQLMSNGSYRVEWWDSKDDWPTFLACLQIYNFRRKTE